MALDGKLKWRLVPIYMIAQYLGGFLAALLLYVNYIEAIEALDGGTRSAFGATNSTGSIFATYPGEWVTIWGALFDQIVGTAMLLFALSAVTDKNNAGLDERHQPLVIALVIGLTCFAFSPNCGAIFNPARDVAPRLLTWLVGYSADVWAPIGGYYWLAAGLVGPHIGAILGYFGYKLLIGSSLNNKRQYDLEQQQQQQPLSDGRHHSLYSMNGGGGVAISDHGKQMAHAKFVQISAQHQDYHEHQQSSPITTTTTTPTTTAPSPVDTNYGSARR